MARWSKRSAREVGVECSGTRVGGQRYGREAVLLVVGACLSVAERRHSGVLDSSKSWKVGNPDAMADVQVAGQ